jgi:N-acetylmuramoyl-L-alanine amidase
MGRKINPPGYHVVDQGDWLSKIAKWYGISKWQSIWDHPQNARLRDERQDPNILYPGDRVYIPAIRQKEDSGSTEQRHKYRLIGDRIKLNLKLIDEEKQPRANVPYKLTIDGESFHGLIFEKRTDGQGRITQDIPVNSEMGYLKVDNQVIQLHLGHLDPIETVSGTQARLANLGYDPGPIDGIEGPLARKAVSEFQADFPPLEVDGICGPNTREKLKEIYGC